jgi:hypothetical protein
MNASWPCGVLHVDDRGVSLRVGWLGRWFDPLDLKVSHPDELTRVYLAKRLAFTGLGLGFTDLKGRDFYFWPMGGDLASRTLERLKAQGYEVDDVPVRARKRWSMVP